jgi:hypothetical protein
VGFCGVLCEVVDVWFGSSVLLEDLGDVVYCWCVHC